MSTTDEDLHVVPQSVEVADEALQGKAVQPAVHQLGHRSLIDAQQLSCPSLSQTALP